jgi:hypothetical protein
MALKSHNKEFVLQRKLTHYGFSSEAVKKYISTQEDIAVICAAEIVDNPKRFREHIHKCAVAENYHVLSLIKRKIISSALSKLILNITYGIGPTLANEKVQV